MEWNRYSIKKYEFYTNNKFWKKIISEKTLIYMTITIRKKIFGNMTLKLTSFQKET